MTLHCSDSRLAWIRTTFTDSIKLLCIEDNLPLCSLLCDDFFRSPVFYKKQVTTIEKARSAIFSKVRYHCWILDLTLEKHNDALDLLKNRSNFPYCMVISGSQSLFDATMAIREGAYGVYDKKTVFNSNPHGFIREACSLAVLSFLLNARKPERLDMFFMLLKKHIESSEEWSRRYCLNERSVRDICEEDAGLTARQFLFFYHVLTAIVVSDCLVEGMAGYDAAFAELESKQLFYEQCAEFVMRNFDMVYGPRFIKDSEGKTIHSPAQDIIPGHFPTKTPF